MFVLFNRRRTSPTRTHTRVVVVVLVCKRTALQSVYCCMRGNPHCGQLAVRGSCCTLLHPASPCSTLLHPASPCITLLHRAARCGFAVDGGGGGSVSVHVGSQPGN